MLQVMSVMDDRGTPDGSKKGLWEWSDLERFRVFEHAGIWRGEKEHFADIHEPVS